MSRIVVRVVLQVVIATVLTVVFAALYFWLLLGETPADALDQSVRLVLVFVDIGIVTWLVLLIIGAVRRRGIGWGFVGSLVAALIGTVVNLVWIVILSVINGGADIFAVALGVQAGFTFLVAVAATELLVRRLILREPTGAAREPDAAPEA